MKEIAENFTIPCAAIVGVGLLGGSIGRGLISRGIAERVIGIGRSHARLQQALASKSVTHVSTDLETSIRQADLVVVCTPVENIAEFVIQAIRTCPGSTLVTDVGSTKSEIVRRIDEVLAEAENFVGSHPMAGSEKTGEVNADPDLFVDRPTIVTPCGSSDGKLVSRCEAFWQSLGAKTFRIGAQEHDTAVAAISHLPHVLASLLAAGTPPDLLKFVSTGWLDTTRVASGDVELWRQILSQNRDDVLRALEEFSCQIDHFGQALRNRDFERISQILEEGKQKRDVVASRYSSE